MLSFFSLTSIHSAFGFDTKISGTDLLTEKPVQVTAEGKKGLVVIFLSAECPCSNSHIEEIRALTQENPEFSFIGIHSNIEESRSLTQNYFKKAALPFPIVHDFKQVLADQFKALKTPHVFIISGSGDVLFQGGVSDSRNFESSKKKYLRDALADIKNHQAVRVSNARTLGCVISRGEKNVW